MSLRTSPKRSDGAAACKGMTCRLRFRISSKTMKARGNSPSDWLDRIGNSAG
jgi:hypothetical protein